MKAVTDIMPYTTDRELLKLECDITFVRDSGPGGQHRNRRETGVRLYHRPSGITITATERRSQNQNLEMAFDRLINRLEDLNKVPKKRIATRPTRSSVKKRLEHKKQLSRKKDTRKKPGFDD